MRKVVYIMTVMVTALLLFGCQRGGEDIVGLKESSDEPYAGWGIKNRVYECYEDGRLVGYILQEAPCWESSDDARITRVKYTKCNIFAEEKDSVVYKYRTRKNYLQRKIEDGEWVNEIPLNGDEDDAIMRISNIWGLGYLGNCNISKEDNILYIKVAKERLDIEIEYNTKEGIASIIKEDEEIQTKIVVSRQYENTEEYRRIMIDDSGEALEYAGIKEGRKWIYSITGKKYFEENDSMIEVNEIITYKVKDSEVGNGKMLIVSDSGQEQEIRVKGSNIEWGRRYNRKSIKVNSNMIGVGIEQKWQECGDEKYYKKRYDCEYDDIYGNVYKKMEKRINNGKVSIEDITLAKDIGMIYMHKKNHGWHDENYDLEYKLIEVCDENDENI